MADLEPIIDRMRALKDEGGIPSNVRTAIGDGINALQDEDEDLSVRINTATSLLDEVSNDPNIAMHTRTEVYSIAAQLESVDTSN